MVYFHQENSNMGLNIAIAGIYFRGIEYSAFEPKINFQTWRWSNLLKCVSFKTTLKPFDMYYHEIDTLHHVIHCIPECHILSGKYRRWAGKTLYVHLAPKHVLTTKHLRRTE